MTENMRTPQQIKEDLEREDAERLANHPGLNDLKKWGKERRRAEAEAERRKEDKLRAMETERQRAEEKRMKESALASWIVSGGSEAEFEGAWPSLKAEMLKRRTLEGEARARAEMQRHFARSF